MVAMQVGCVAHARLLGDKKGPVRGDRGVFVALVIFILESFLGCTPLPRLTS